MKRTRPAETVEHVTIRFAGDSGDGMQLTGNQFTSTAAAFGNDLATLPDFPAEIRAPAGTLPGVSGFQVQFAASDVSTPGDTPDVLVAMNPAALKVNLEDLKPGGVLIVNTNSFTPKDLKKAGYEESPLEDHSLDGYRLHPVELTRLTRAALEQTGLDTRTIDRCKNFFALGMMYWLYSRPLDNSLRWIEQKFAKQPALLEANSLALRAGYGYAEAAELFEVNYVVPPAKLDPGQYRNVSGNTALALGLVAAGQRSGLRLFLGSYPITPASDVLHELSGYKHFGVITFQAEDEIAAVGAALGASFAGNLGVTTTSGPGVALKTETIGLATMAELPLVICNIQRGGPSTGLPTKTEQADLFQALFGRNSEAPVPVLAAATPSDCFRMAYEACRIAVHAMTPVFLLSDGYLANGAEPWKIPEVDRYPPIEVSFRKEPEGFLPYLREPETLSRPWAVPGTSGLEHRIGGLEKEERSGNVSYDPGNHERMVRLRAEKIDRIAASIPDQEIEGDQEGDLLVVGWGSTYGAIHAAMAHRKRREGDRIGHAHLRYLHPLPRNLEDVLKRYRRILVPELNMGQLLWVLRARYLVDAIGLNKIQGRPFTENEIIAKIDEILEGDAS
ncbi:MAG: 2-oxoacid:acceptor oxidoreductase subunit alpha [Candidatus Eisenbacteria bacterium]|nr:2-oxoacid:acceptor oxidoreductase subunit alpha [Candidatus Latescibacterota bacterium]MBD3302793.1 2-oxoacid:acceptor oxidoreductase subunit alpha [Candidatus Eisenbacteria bacterium]